MVFLFGLVLFNFMPFQMQIRQEIQILDAPPLATWCFWAPILSLRFLRNNLRSHAPPLRLSIVLLHLVLLRYLGYVWFFVNIILCSPPTLYCDNVFALAFASNLVFHTCMKQIEVDYHFIRERVIRKDL